LVLLVLGLFFFLPFYWLVITSLKSDTEVFAMPPVWVPKELLWGNFARAVTYVPFFLFLKNTLVICGFSVVGTLLSSSLVAYSFSRIRWQGRDTLFVLVLATMMLPGQVTLIPVFAIFRTLGWVDTIAPLVVPHFLGTAFYIFMLRQFFMTIPFELSDAARMDGCSEWDIFRRVIVPLSRPALATVGLFTFINSWNDFLGPLIYLNDMRTYTVPLALRAFVDSSGGESLYGEMFAMSTLSLIPVFVVFLAFQRLIIRGVALGALKR
jgi:multiple sugar transport system permease protein